MDTVELAGRMRPVVLPSYGVRQLLLEVGANAVADGKPAVLTLFSSAAYIGLCTDMAQGSGITLSGKGYDALAYGEAVYSLLCERGVDQEEIARVGVELIRAVTGSFNPPTDEEVDAAVGFSGGAPG